nr:MAG TPA: hypothetical protein [Caudoviricetes sp.]
MESGLMSLIRQTALQLFANPAFKNQLRIQRKSIISKT